MSALHRETIGTIPRATLCLREIITYCMFSRTMDFWLAYHVASLLIKLVLPSSASQTPLTFRTTSTVQTKENRGCCKTTPYSSKCRSATLRRGNGQCLHATTHANAHWYPPVGLLFFSLVTLCSILKTACIPKPIVANFTHTFFTKQRATATPKTSSLHGAVQVRELTSIR